MAIWLYEENGDLSQKLPEFLAKRNVQSIDVTTKVAAIIADIKQQGDQALFAYTRRWDKLQLTADTIRVSEREMDNAIAACKPNLITALKNAVQRITSYHEQQLPADRLFHDKHGNELGWQWKPISKIGIYVPAGQAAYPSSVLMNAIPAKVAGVRQIIMAVPASDGQLNPSILAAAHIVGIDEIYKIGGAQAIAAMAYGTESVPAVDKIVGPGNLWVAEAKRQLFGTVGIDMVAGPSEICVVADAHSNPEWVAYDLLSQAEHDHQAQSILITDSQELAQAVEQQIKDIMPSLSRSEIATSSWQEYGAIIIIQDICSAPKIVNIIAPEHVEYVVANPHAMIAQTHAAGAIFVGNYSPEALGDYIAGPSHVLPTMGTARFSSGLSVYDFLNRQSIISATVDGFAEPATHAIAIAEAEGLTAHATSMKVRLK